METQRKNKSLTNNLRREKKERMIFVNFMNSISGNNLSATLKKSFQNILICNFFIKEGKFAPIIGELFNI